MSIEVEAASCNQYYAEEIGRGQNYYQFHQLFPQLRRKKRSVMEKTCPAEGTENAEYTAIPDGHCALQGTETVI